MASWSVDQMWSFTAENPYVWFVLILNLSTPVTYWGVGSIYLLLDWTKRPKWIQRYRIRDKKDKELDMKTLIMVRNEFNLQECCKTKLFLQILFLKDCQNRVIQPGYRPNILCFVSVSVTRPASRSASSVTSRSLASRMSFPTLWFLDLQRNNVLLLPSTTSLRTILRSLP